MRIDEELKVGDTVILNLTGFMMYNVNHPFDLARHNMGELRSGIPYRVQYIDRSRGGAWPRIKAEALFFGEGYTVCIGGRAVSSTWLKKVGQLSNTPLEEALKVIYQD